MGSKKGISFIFNLIRDQSQIIGVSSFIGSHNDSKTSSYQLIYFFHLLNLGNSLKT